MSRLLARAALFLGGLAVCFVAASVYYELRVRQTDDFLLQIAQFRQPDVDPEVLFLGDSRMAANIDQQSLPAGYYNFSYPGETLRHMYLRLKFALETKPGIRYLVLGLEDVGFSDARAYLRDATRQTVFADLVDLTEAYPTNPRMLLRHAVLHYVPLVNATQRHRAWNALVDDVNALVTGRRPARVEELQCGSVKPVGEALWPRYSAEQRRAHVAERVPELLGGSVQNPAMHRLVYMIINTAHRHGVRVIGLRNPLSGAYLEAARPRYDGPVLDFLDRDWLDGMLDYETTFAERPGLFFNEDHLNARGARLFTRRVVDDLAPMVRVAADGPAVACRGRDEIAAPGWPYNDLVASWLRTPRCHNLKADCSPLPQAASRPGKPPAAAFEDPDERDGGHSAPRRAPASDARTLHSTHADRREG